MPVTTPLKKMSLPPLEATNHLRFPPLGRGAGPVAVEGDSLVPDLVKVTPASGSLSVVLTSCPGSGSCTSSCFSASHILAADYSVVLAECWEGDVSYL